MGNCYEEKEQKDLVMQEVGVVCSHMTIFIVTVSTPHCHMFLHCGTPLFCMDP